MADQPQESDRTDEPQIDGAADGDVVDSDVADGQAADGAVSASDDASHGVVEGVAEGELEDGGVATAIAADLPDFSADLDATGDGELSMLKDVTLQVKIELGRTRMYIDDVLKLCANSVVELDKAAGDPVDIYVNDRLIARGEVLVLDENFCVRISEILKPVTTADSRI